MGGRDKPGHDDGTGLGQMAAPSSTQSASRPATIPAEVIMPEAVEVEAVRVRE
jgi:hypothetical protein